MALHLVSYHSDFLLAILTLCKQDAQDVGLQLYKLYKLYFAVLYGFIMGIMNKIMNYSAEGCIRNIAMVLFCREHFKVRDCAIYFHQTHFTSRPVC